MRRTIFANEEYYHIYNRGVDKRNVFLNERDYERFILGMVLLNDERNGLMEAWRDIKKFSPKAKLKDILKLSFRINPGVEIISYCLNKNHYHFILKQLRDNGIESFMHRISTSHTKYFNKKYNRSGSLFQGPFKAIHIDSNEYLLHLAVYVNFNCQIHRIAQAEDYLWSSWRDMKIGKSDFCNFESVIGQFRNQSDMFNFFRDSAKVIAERKEMQDLFMEEI